MSNTELEQALNDLKEALKGTDAARMKSATDAALQASQKLGEAMYKAQQGAAQGAAGAQQAGPQPGAEQAQASGNKEDVVEAEVVDK
jgi:molecular chaperone DnaK